MTAKLFKHPKLWGSFIIETNNGCFEVTNEYVKNTLISTDDLEPLPWDMDIQTVMDNAQVSSQGILTTYEVSLLRLLVDEKVEDFD